MSSCYTFASITRAARGVNGYFENVDFFYPPPQYGLPKDALEFWFDRARVMTRRMVQIENVNWNLALRHAGGFDEDANGAEWLMGYAGHEKFHHKQMDEMIERVRDLK